ncbi:hypothetical protein [Streptomyces odonnellii]|uniref:hypothetical protein n=1 Tax=Streptomyces odonnellii TaxID=1417980 RepID=UPI000626D8A1|nr:hypothetical protein [Streptomyces odonnellii]
MGVMCAMRVVGRVLLVVTATAAAVGTAADPGAWAATDAPRPGSAVPEADLSHHGHVSLSNGALTVRLQSENHGPSPLPDATVRLDFSVPLPPGQELPAACVQAGDRTVLCPTGRLRALQRGTGITLDLRTAGQPDEVAVRIGTAWNGGAIDDNPGNNEHRVLVLETGDRNAF